MKLLTLLLSIIFISNAYGDINLWSGIKYTTPTKTSITQPTEPTEPTVNMIWQNPETGEVKVYDGTKWLMVNNTQMVKDEIAIFKANFSGITDPKAKACIKSLGKILLYLYRENLE
jgi:hypothetical protein